MRSLSFAIVALGVCFAGRALADDGDWPSLETALQGRLLRVETAPAPATRFTESIHPFRLLPARCPNIPVEAGKAYGVKVQFEPKRTHNMRVLVGKLPEGFDVYAAITAAAPAPASEDGCWMPKSGLSFLQFGRYLLAFPTTCGDIYPYKKSLPLVIRSLKDFWGARSPKQFIYAPCGTMFPQLVDIDAYLRDPEAALPRRNVALRGVEPDGGSPEAPARR